mmetsp:Transcript_18854/g.25576  ORF Transcript_18854/g.25576 Transcript_18854/m.25576 type:complete len:109 (-) Transcript_18854:605-931(-)
MVIFWFELIFLAVTLFSGFLLGSKILYAKLLGLSKCMTGLTVLCFGFSYMAMRMMVNAHTFETLTKSEGCVIKYFDEYFILSSFSILLIGGSLVYSGIENLKEYICDR